MLEVINSEPYRDLSVKQIVPRLCGGVYLASESTMYRILEQEALMPTVSRRSLANTLGRNSTSRPAHRSCSAGTTYLPSTVRGEFFYLHLFLDVWSRKIVGWGVNDVQCGTLASELLMAVCDDMNLDSDGVVLHADNGKQMKGSSMLSTMQWLGIVPSFSRPNVSDDNPYVEALFRTLKYRPGYSSQRFTTLKDAIAWVARFVRWYNHEHLHSGIGFVTPHDRHTGADVAQLAGRRAVYAKAHARHPERWTGNVRSWQRPRIVKLDSSTMSSPRAYLNAAHRQKIPTIVLQRHDGLCTWRSHTSPRCAETSPAVDGRALRPTTAHLTASSQIKGAIQEATRKNDNCGA